MARYSSDLQNPRSADDQIREGMAYAERNGWIIAGTDKDEAKTGRTTVGRTGFFNAMAAAEAGLCDIILVEDISRFARDAADALMAARKLKENNVSICTIGGGVLDGMMLGIRAQMAQEQSEETGRRVKRGHRSAAMRGRAMGSLAYGYLPHETENGHGLNRVVDEAKRPVVVRIFKDLAAGVSSLAIARALNAEGVPAPDGGKWRPKTITGDPNRLNGIVRNPIYAGKLVYGKSKSTYVSSEGVREVSTGLQVDQIITDAPELRMIDDELWMEVQEIMDERGRKLLNEKGEPVPNRVRGPKHPLSGLIKCGCCGSTYAVAGDRLACDGRRLGICENSRRVGRQEVQAAVFEGIKQRLLLPDLMNQYVDEYRREFEEASAQQVDRTATMDARRREVDRQIENLLSLARMGSSDTPGAALLHADLEKLAAEKKRLEREARQRRPIAPLTMDTDGVIQRLGAMIDDLGEALEGPERDAARAKSILRSFITRVVVTPHETVGKADRRGSGPVRVTVEGPLAALLGLASIDRVVQRCESPLPALNPGKSTFSIYIDLSLSSLSERTFADIAFVSRRLDDARAPLRKRDLIAAMEIGKARSGSEQAGPDVFQRVSAALKHLRASGLIRPVVVTPSYTGWVWNDAILTDEEWCRRAQNPAAAANKVWRVIPPRRFREHNL